MLSSEQKKGRKRPCKGNPLGLIVSGLEEALQTLDVVRGRSQTVRVRRQRFGIDVVEQLWKVRFALGSQVHDGQVEVGERPQLTICRALSRSVVSANCSLHQVRVCSFFVFKNNCPTSLANTTEQEIWVAMEWSSFRVLVLEFLLKKLKCLPNYYGSFHYVLRLTRTI